MIDIKKTYYLAHPCTTGGKSIEENKELEKLAFEQLQEHYPGVKVIRPLVLIPENMEHQEAMLKCFKLLNRCDSAIFAGHWMISKGCQMELDFCLKNGKGIIEFGNLFSEVAV